MPQSSDTYLSVTPDGHITFNFSGATVAAHDFQFTDPADPSGQTIMGFFEGTHLLATTYQIAVALITGETSVLIRHDGQEAVASDRNKSGYLRFPIAGPPIGGHESDRITYGASPAFTWSGGATTVVSGVPHNLGRVPKAVIVSNGGDPSGGDGRFPLAVTAQAFTSTTFDLVYRTHDNTVIGVFGLGAGVSSWVAFG